MSIKFTVTYHAIERLQQRFPKFCAKYPALSEWSYGRGINGVNRLLIQMLDEASENKSFINNTKYMVSLYEKYGYDVDYKMMELPNDGIIFVLTKPRNANLFIIVTVVPEEYIPRNTFTKYNKTKTKKTKDTEYMLGLYDDYHQSIKLIDNPVVMDSRPDDIITYETIFKQWKSGMTKCIHRNDTNLETHRCKIGEYVCMFDIRIPTQCVVTSANIRNVVYHPLISHQTDATWTSEMKFKLWSMVIDGDDNLQTLLKLSKRFVIYCATLENQEYYFVNRTDIHEIEKSIVATNLHITMPSLFNHPETV